MSINSNSIENSNVSEQPYPAFSYFKARVNKDLTFDIDWVSENYHQITGVPATKAGSSFLSFTERILPHARHRFLRELGTALKSGSHIRLPVPMICEKQSVIHLDFKAAPVHKEDESYYFCILCPLAPKMESPTVKKQKFLGMLIHEMRHPLMGILSSIDIMRHNQKTNSMDTDDYLGVIEQSGEALLGMVDDLLEYSESLSNYREDQECLVNLNELFAAARSLVLSNIIKKRLRFEMRSHSPVPESVRTYPKRLTQIINNLLSNSVKYTDTGTICLEILSCEPCAEGYNLVFSIRDTGIGMSQEVQNRIFEPFFRGDSRESGNPGGSGLGLYIVKELVVSLHGEISCRSQIGLGSEFLVQIKVHNP